MANKPPTEPLSDHGMASFMLRQTVRNSVAHHRDGTPISENFERGRKMLAPDLLADEVASHLRFIIVDHAAGREQSPKVCDETEAKYIFNRPPVEPLESELVHMEKNVDPNSFASLALLADLYMEAGYGIEARMAYEKALKVARANGGSYAE